MTDPNDTPHASPSHNLSPLAEGRWLWRRIYVFAASFGLWSLLSDVVRAAPLKALPGIFEGLTGLLALLLVLYLVAPTAQQLIELMAQTRSRLNGLGTNRDAGR